MDYENMIKHLDHTLVTKNLYPEEYERLSQLRGRLVGELEARRKQEALSMLRREARRALEERTPGLFIGEKLTRAPRFEIPREFGHAGRETILRHDLETPAQSDIRDFVPNESYRDPVNIDPGRLMRQRSRMLHRI